MIYYLLLVVFIIYYLLFISQTNTIEHLTNI